MMALGWQPRPLLFCLGILCLLTPASAETVLLDAEVGAGPLVLEVYQAEVQVFIDAAGENFVQAIEPAAKSRLEADSLNLERLNDGIEVRRVATQSEAALKPSEIVRIRFDVVLTPGTPLLIRGHDLSILIEDTAYARRTPEAATAEEPEADDDTPGATAEEASNSPQADTAKTGTGQINTAPAVLRLDVQRSEVEAFGVADLTVKADRGQLRLEGTHGRMLLETTDSIASVVGHRGFLQGLGRGGELSVEDVDGSVELDYQGGEVRFRGGEGSIAAHLAGSAFELDGWKGDLGIEGNDAVLRVREGRSSGKGIDIRGKSLDVQVDTWRGNLTMVLEGGQLSGGPWHGKLAVTARQGTLIDLQPLFGQLKLWLRENASAHLAGITGLLQADLEGSRLDLDGVTRNLELDAKDSNAHLSGMEHIRKLRASGSQVTVDLAHLRASRPTFEALAGSDLRIDAPAPCLVDINTPSALDQLDLDISGCEQKQLGVGRRRRAPTRLDGSPMTRFVIRLSEDSSVDVEGR